MKSREEILRELDELKADMERRDNELADHLETFLASEESKLIKDENRNEISRIIKALRKHGQTRTS